MSPCHRQLLQHIHPRVFVQSEHDQDGAHTRDLQWRRSPYHINNANNCCRFRPAIGLQGIYCCLREAYREPRYEMLPRENMHGTTCRTTLTHLTEIDTAAAYPITNKATQPSTSYDNVPLAQPTLTIICTISPKRSDPTGACHTRKERPSQRLSHEPAQTATAKILPL